MNELSHRSPETPDRFFRKLGSIHVHVDAGDAEHVVNTLIAEIKPEIEKLGLKFKLNKICRATAGAQRLMEDFEQTYQSHTPGESDAEVFDTFATIGGFKENDTISDTLQKVIGDLLVKLGHEEKLVIETERINGILIDGKWQEWPDEKVPREIPTITEGKAGQTRSFTAPIEIHHAIDFNICTVEEKPPISPEELLAEMQNSGIQLGGLFLFDKNGTWSFRTSQFTHYDDYVEVALIDHNRLRRCLQSRNLAASVWTITEQVLGVWKTGFPSSDQTKCAVTSVPGLAHWVRHCESGDELWVVGSDFLEDTDPDVAAAMRNSFLMGVQTTYFLRSHADVRRLRHSVSRLENEIGPRINELITVVLLISDLLPNPSGRSALACDYFISNPNQKASQTGRRRGYHLEKFKRSGNLKQGRLMSSDDLDRLVKILNETLVDWPLGAIAPNASAGFVTHGSVLLATLEKGAERHAELPSPKKLESLEEYDLIIAREVSRARGEVLKSTENSYMCFFRDYFDPGACAARALRCATRLQYRLALRNESPVNKEKQSTILNQRIAIAYGALKVVERSHGYAIAGDELAKCDELLKVCTAGHILSTIELWEEANRELQWKEECIHQHSDIQVNGFAPVSCVEILWSKPDGTRTAPIQSFTL